MRRSLPWRLRWRTARSTRSSKNWSAFVAYMQEVPPLAHQHLVRHKSRKLISVWQAPVEEEISLNDKGSFLTRRNTFVGGRSRRQRRKSSNTWTYCMRLQASSQRTTFPRCSRTRKCSRPTVVRDGRLSRNKNRRPQSRRVNQMTLRPRRLRKGV